VTPAAASIQVSAPVTDALSIQVGASVTAGSFPVSITATGVGHVHTAQILIQVLTVAAPVLTPTPGTYTTAQTVTISEATGNAIVYYTTNGTTPTASSTRYTGAITVSATETLKAIALVSGSAPSSIAGGTYTIAPLVATPVFSLSAGTYISAQTLTITDSTAGATIYYTTNGTTPTTSSTVYTGPITVWSTTPLTETIQAIAAAPGDTNSPICSATYVLAPLVVTPVITPPAGTYATTQTVTIATTTPNATIHYVLNGANLNPGSPVYTGPISVSASESIQAFAASPGYANSVVVSAAYIITSQITAAPTFSLASGTYISAHTLTILDSTPGAVIYYTTDGSTPTNTSKIYTGPISVWSTTPVTETIQAIAQADGYAASPVVSATYVLAPMVVTPVFTPAGGPYATAQTVTLTTTTPNATIHYVLNGATLNSGSPVYTGPITVSASESIQAFAASPGYANSVIASAAYTISSSITATPIFSLPAGAYRSAQTLTISDGTPNATIYYTTDGSTPTAGSTPYTGPLTIWSTTPLTETVQAIAVASGYANSPVFSATYVLYPLVATPTFTPAPGTYTTTQSVTIATTTPNATIYYAINGATLNTGSTKYTGPITVSASETIQAFSGSSGYANSLVTTAVYTINSSGGGNISISPRTPVPISHTQRGPAPQQTQ
jgi:hypothetical protein